MGVEYINRPGREEPVDLRFSLGTITIGSCYGGWGGHNWDVTYKGVTHRLASGSSVTFDDFIIELENDYGWCTVLSASTFKLRIPEEEGDGEPLPIITELTAIPRATQIGWIDVYWHQDIAGSIDIIVDGWTVNQGGYPAGKNINTVNGLSLGEHTVCVDPTGL